MVENIIEDSKKLGELKAVGCGRSPRYAILQQSTHLKNFRFFDI